MTSVLIMMVVALVVLLVHQHLKKNSAEALNDNLESKEKVLEKEKEIAKNEGLITAEEEKRKQIESDLEKKKNEEVSKDNLLDFFNNRSSDNDSK